MIDKLEREFHELFSEYVNSETIEKLFDDVVTQYTLPGRYYHTLEHVAAGVALLNAYKGKLRINKHVLKVAFFYHDFYYDVDRKDNEARSGEYIHRLLLSLGFSQEFCDDVLMCVLATNYTFPVTDDVNCKVIRDIDLSAFAANYETFEKNSHQIWLEYASIISIEQFYANRKQFLSEFNKQQIYLTDIVPNVFEATAHQNIARYLKAL